MDSKLTKSAVAIGLFLVICASGLRNRLLGRLRRLVGMKSNLKVNEGVFDAGVASIGGKIAAQAGLRAKV